MSEDSFIAALGRSYGKLPAKKRIAKIQELAQMSKPTEKFLKDFFPEFYLEAFPRKKKKSA